MRQKYSVAVFHSEVDGLTIIRRGVGKNFHDVTGVESNHPRCCRKRWNGDGFAEHNRIIVCWNGKGQDSGIRYGSRGNLKGAEDQKENAYVDEQFLHVTPTCSSLFSDLRFP